MITGIAIESNAFPILTFHSLDDRAAVISFSPRLFGRGIAALRQSGYRTLPLRDAVNSLKRRMLFPHKHLAITFDDGYTSVYQHAFPILAEHQLSATIFLTVGKTKSDRLPALNGRAMLSWNERRRLLIR